MQGKLQELTDKIYQEGIGKAKEDSDRILAEANSKAQVILQDARKEAERIKTAAAEEAAALKDNVASEIRLAGQQAISVLKQKITSLVVDTLLKEQVSGAFGDGGFMKKMIEVAVGAWDPKSGALTLELPETARGELEGYVKSGALEKLRSGLDVRFSSSIEGGFRVGPAEGGFLVSFTDEGFINYFKEYLRPRAGKFLFGE